MAFDVTLAMVTPVMWLTARALFHARALARR
jgi:hypothetical protein